MKEAEEKLAAAKENNDGYTQIVLSEEDITESEAAEATVYTVHSAISAQQSNEMAQTVVSYYEIGADDDDPIVIEEDED